ncbi:hypothetical protein TCDM_12460 [Trypanosoma cruzi Dm28c]|uniref:Uncharacterized protein n=1 Tax=Trypanosoma cruzi Dm28c TaxID=1416333 RepID=V5A868_TRYCR|nr:hypothetical protein TCDM_12460 [Trypanosoma cruzi Dm28c]
MAITVLRLQQFRVQAPRAAASQRPTEIIHILFRARPVRCPRRYLVKFQRNNRADVLIHQTPLVLNDACGARTNVTAAGGAAKRLCVFSIAKHVRILGGKIIGCIALVGQEVAATAASPAHRLRHPPIHAVVSQYAQKPTSSEPCSSRHQLWGHQLVPRVASLPVRDFFFPRAIFVLQHHALERVTTKVCFRLLLNVLPGHHPAVRPTHTSLWLLHQALFSHAFLAEPRRMCNFVCGNANAPRRVSHVLRIKVDGANVGAKIRRCVTRGRPHNAHAQANPHPSITTRQQNFLPSRLQWDTEPTTPVTRGASHPQERRLGLRTPSLFPSPHATEEDNSRHTQLPACTAKEAFKIHCNVHLVCVPADTRGKEIEKREQSM